MRSQLKLLAEIQIVEREVLEHHNVIREAMEELQVGVVFKYASLGHCR